METAQNSILIDFRENRSKVPEFLAQLGVNTQTADLAADYIIGKDCRVERKTVADFVTSIADGRLFRQVADLAKNCKNPLLLLEGGGLYLHRRVPPNVIRGAIIWITVVKKVAFIRTCDESDTAHTLCLLAKKFAGCQNLDAEPLRHKRKFISPWQRQVNVLAQIPGIGRQTAKNFLAAFGSIDKITQASDMELMAISGLGKGRLQSIRQIFPRTPQGTLLQGQKITA